MKKIKTRKRYYNDGFSSHNYNIININKCLVFNTQDSVYIKRLNNLYSDIELLRAKNR